MQIHRCYCQLKGFTAIVKTQEIELMVYTNKRFHIKNVIFDKNKWTKEIL